VTTAIDAAPATPDFVAVSWVCDRYRLATTTVHHAIRTGALPAVPVLGATGVSAYAIRPPDAASLWGHRDTEEGR
jgi:hypothetical protein